MRRLSERSEGSPDRVLRHELAGLGAQPILQRLALGGIEHADDDGLAVGAEAGAHDHRIEMRHGEGIGRGLAQPPHVERGDQQLLAQHLLAEPLEERHQRRRLHQARAQRVGQHDLAAARRLDQAGDAQCGVGAQLQRIGEGAVEPAQQHVHGPEASQRLDRDLAVARHQVAAFDQRDAQRAREIDMLEIGRRQRARRQQRHRGIGDVGRRHGGQRMVPAVDEGPQMPHRDRAEGLGQAARQHAADLQRIARARRHLGMVGQHMPAPVAQPHQVDGILGEVARRPAAVGGAAGAQEMAVGMDQHRRHQPLGQHLLRPVEVGQEAIEQLRALAEARLQRLPLVGGDHEGQRVERPVGRAAVVEQVEGRARFLQLPPRALDTVLQPAARQIADDAENPLPVIADRLLAGDQLVVCACRRGREAAQRLHALRFARVPLPRHALLLPRPTGEGREGGKPQRQSALEAARIEHPRS